LSKKHYPEAEASLALIWILLQLMLPSFMIMQ